MKRASTANTQTQMNFVNKGLRTCISRRVTGYSIIYRAFKKLLKSIINITRCMSMPLLYTQYIHSLHNVLYV